MKKEAVNAQKIRPGPAIKPSVRLQVCSSSSGIAGLQLIKSRIIRNMHSSVKDENTDDKTFKRKAILPKGRNTNSLEKIVYRGYPGGCGIPKCQAAAASSPASPEVTEGAR